SSLKLTPQKEPIQYSRLSAVGVAVPTPLNPLWRVPVPFLASGSAAYAPTANNTVRVGPITRMEARNSKRLIGYPPWRLSLRFGLSGRSPPWGSLHRLW